MYASTCAQAFFEHVFFVSDMQVCVCVCVRACLLALQQRPNHVPKAAYTSHDTSKSFPETSRNSPHMVKTS